jgi:heme/copper-type cytochrome/quinol oxidase subunit 2
MSNKKMVVIVGAVIIVIVVAIVGIFYWSSGNNSQNSGATTPGGSGVGSGVSPNTPTSSTRTAAPTDVTVPNEGATTTVAANVAVPVVQGAGDPAGNVSYRSFNITIKNGAYSPDTVIVNQGDTVNLELTAVDAAYGFTQPDYGFNAKIAEGKTQTIQFQALQTGSFIFYCASCGGPSKGPVGHIIIVAPSK